MALVQIGLAAGLAQVGADIFVQALGLEEAHVGENIKTSGVSFR